MAHHRLHRTFSLALAGIAALALLSLPLAARASVSSGILSQRRAVTRNFSQPTFTVYVAGQTPGFSADAQPFGITAGPDGNVWFTEQTGGSTPPSLARISPSGQVTEFATGAFGISQPYSIVAGADGNLWFTDVAAHAIGRMTTSGNVTEFTSGLSPDDAPAGLTRAADGSMWFVSSGTGPYVGRIDLSGNIIEVAHLRTTQMSADPSIAQDANGNFWFTQSDHFSHEFAIEVTPNGHTRRELLPLVYSLNPCCVTQSSQAFAVAADGTPWFANLTYTHQRSGTHLLGHVVNGRVQTVHNPVPFISSLAAGPGGKLWYAAQDPFFAAPGLGYLNGDEGGFHRFTLPRATNPISLAYGPDGNLWMSGYDGKTGLIIEATP